MIILAILFCIGFILMCIVGFFHAMIKNRREEKALQYDSSAKYDASTSPSMILAHMMAFTIQK